MRKIILAFLTVAFLFACKKSERVEQTTYEPLDSFYEMYQEQTQEFVIDTAGEGPIIGNQGSHIYLNDIFMMPDSSDVTLPFTLKIVEIYEKDQMMLSRAPSVLDNHFALITGGMVSVYACKDTVDLLFKPNASLLLKFPEKHEQSTTMNHFFGLRDASNLLNLNIHEENEAVLDSNFYHVYTNRLGFVSPSRLLEATPTTYTVSFVAMGVGVENIAKYLVFEDSHTVVRINETSSIPINEGTALKFIAFAKDQNGDFRIHEEDFNLTENKQIQLSMQVITEVELLAKLEALN